MTKKYVYLHFNKEYIMIFILYKETEDFPISGGNMIHINYKPSIRRVVKAIAPLINKKTNIKIDERAKNKIFINDFIRFCELENIDYKSILEFTVKVIDKETISIIVNKGENNNVFKLTI